MFKPKLFLLMVFNLGLFSMHSYAQDLKFSNRWVDSLIRTIKEVRELKQVSFLNFSIDSAAKSKFSNVFTLDTTILRHIPIPSKFPKKNLTKPFFIFSGGVISYDWNFRTLIDTPFQETNISQHLISTKLDFIVAQSVPLTLTYFDRETNSKFFKDYRDVRLEFNSQEFQRLQSQQLATYINQFTDQLRNPITKPSLDLARKEINQIQGWLRQRDVENKLIASRIAIVNGGRIDTLTKMLDTSVLDKARVFVDLYDLVKLKSEKLQQFHDSLQKQYVQTEKDILAIKKVIAGRGVGVDTRDLLENILSQYGVNEHLKKIFSNAVSIRTLALGKTVPNHSELTVKNINVNGVNFEYNRKFYFAFAAGAVEYRARDFFYSKQKRKPQFVYVARFGYGLKEGSHFYLTGFKGKKQLLSTSISAPSIDIYGLSFESQLVINRNHRLIAELAQSATPTFINSIGSQEKPTFNIDDKNNKAYSIKLNSYFPKYKLRLEGLYKYRGINYQSFSTYYFNASLHQWHIKFDQYLFNRRLHINASVSKNNFENPDVLTRYTGNTVFKNLSIAFSKPKWPRVSVAYMPSSQLSEVNGQVYENFYQALNFSLNHFYKVGLAQAISVFNYNQFYNDSRDSGFIYYNAKNFFFNQHLQFLSYAADVNITVTKSRDYTLTVFDAGASAKIFKQSSIGLGVKINQLNSEELKIGLYGNQKIVIPKLGEINIWIEKSYLPGWKGNLVKTEFYNIGFFRVIK